MFNIRKAGLKAGEEVAGRKVVLEEIRAVWYRRPVASEPSPRIEDHAAKEFIVEESRESLLGLWRILPCFWISHPDSIRIAESKIRKMQIASTLDLSIPETLITNSPSSALEFYRKRRHVICKPLRKARIDRQDSTSFIYTSKVREQHVKSITNVRLAPTLFQPLIQKNVDIRVTVVGNLVFAVAIYSQDLREARQD